MKLKQKKSQITLVDDLAVTDLFSMADTEACTRLALHEYNNNNMNRSIDIRCNDIDVGSNLRSLVERGEVDVDVVDVVSVIVNVVVVCGDVVASDVDSEQRLLKFVATLSLSTTIVDVVVAALTSERALLVAAVAVVADDNDDDDDDDDEVIVVDVDDAVVEPDAAATMRSATEHHVNGSLHIDSHNSRTHSDVTGR